MRALPSPVSLSSSPPPLPSPPSLIPAPTPSTLTLHAHLSHRGSSLTLSLPADLSISSLQPHLTHSFHLPPHDQLLLTSDGRLLDPSSSALLSSYASSSSAVEVWVYSQSQLFSPISPAPTSLPSSFPLSPSTLAFLPDASSPSLPSSTFPYLASSPSILLRSLPDYLRAFHSYHSICQSTIEFIDQLCRRCHSAVQLMASINASLPPLAAYAERVRAQAGEDVIALEGERKRKEERWSDALQRFEGELTALADVRLPPSLTVSGVTSLLHYVDQAAVRARFVVAKREKERFDSRLADLISRHSVLHERLALIRSSAGMNEALVGDEVSVDHQRWIDSWSEQRRECVGWMNDMVTHRNEAHSHAAHINSLLSPVSASSTPLHLVEGDARHRIDALEQLSRLDRDERLPSLRAILAGYQREAEALLEWSVRKLSWYEKAVRVAAEIEAEAKGVSGGALLASESLKTCERAMTVLERIVRLRESWEQAVKEVGRRRRRAQGRKKGVERAVQQWTEEDAEEANRRVNFWKDFGMNLQGTLPPAIIRSLKEEAGWVRVELRDDEAQLPPLTLETSEWKEQEEPTKSQQNEKKEEEESLMEKIHRLEEENHQLKLTLLSQPSTHSPPDSVSRAEYDAMVLNSASVENALKDAQDQLLKERQDSKELAQRLTSAKKALTKSEQRREQAEKEATEVRERALTQVSILDIAVNDLVMAVREGQGRWRVRGWGNKPMFLSSESVTALRQRGGEDVDWAVGHVIIIESRVSKGKEVQALGVKEGEDYWLLTIALVDRPEKRDVPHPGTGGKLEVDGHSSLDAMILATP